MTRVLIVNPFGIGDVLFSTPLIRAVRRAFPESFIGYLCNRRTEPILKTNPHVNEIHVYEKDEILRLWRTSWRNGLRQVLALLRRIRRLKYDLVIDLSLGERYGLIMKLLGVRQLVGFNYRRRGRFLTESLAIEGYQGDHVVSHYRRLLQFLGIRMAEEALELHVDETDVRWARQWLERQHLTDGRPVIGIVPAGGVSWGIDAPFRRWSLEGFASIGDRLAAQHQARILLFGEASDAPVCQAVAKCMRHPVRDLSGQTTLGQFVALLGRLSLVVCNDGGPLHLAVSQGVRTVSIFGPVDPTVYGPHPATPSRHRAISQEHLPCRPCYHQFKLPPCPYERACLTTIRPEDVLGACKELLAASPDLMGMRD